MSDLLTRKREIITTTNSVGWRFIKELGEEAVRAAERRAIDEEDDAKGATLRRQAKAARVFYDDFLQAIEAMRDVNAPESNGTDSTYFYDVAN